MPFGKHKGRPVRDLDTGYLRWALKECDLKPQLYDAVKSELRRRGERHVDAAAVLGDLEEELTARISDDDGVVHENAGILCDHVMMAFDVIRERWGISSVTELVVLAKERRGQWGQ